MARLPAGRRNWRTENTLSLGLPRQSPENVGRVPRESQHRKESGPRRALSTGSCFDLQAAGGLPQARAGQARAGQRGRFLASRERTWKTGLAGFCGVRGQPSQQAAWLSRGSWGPFHPQGTRAGSFSTVGSRVTPRCACSSPQMRRITEATRAPSGADTDTGSCGAGAPALSPPYACGY